MSVFEYGLIRAISGFITGLFSSIFIHTIIQTLDFSGILLILIKFLSMWTTFETTANIGVINGGTATNIVPELVEVRGEVRSHNRAKLKRQLEKIRKAFQKEVERAQRPEPEFKGLPKLEEEILFDYPLMRLDEGSFLVNLFKEAGSSLGMKITTKIGSGGSDANIFNSLGIETLIMGCGMERVHTTEERLNINWFYQSAKLLACVIELYYQKLKNG